VQDYEPNDVKMIINAAEMLCEKIVMEFEHKTPDEIYDIAELLLKEITAHKNRRNADGDIDFRRNKRDNY